MGGSSSQTIGQRYFAKLTTFIGNPIEKLIGINFDNRGWIFKPDNDETFLRVESPNLYGDKEGGVAGFIDIHTGTADQLPNATYEKDFPKVSGYPFQSYLVFRGLGKKTATSGGIGQFTRGSPKHYNKSFYHGNSGYMKEMLLWPQRIHVRNDGQAQWYDLKAEIGKYTHLAPGGQYVPLSSPFSGVVSWTDPGGSGSRKESSSGFPFFDAVQSYEIGVGVNGNPLPEQPSLIAAAAILSAHGMSIEGGTIIPPVTSTSYPPETDGFWNGAIIRNYEYESFFNWAGGDFEYKGVFSENGASVTLDKVNPDGSFSDGISIADHIPGGGYFYTEGKVNLSRGDYRITVDVGTRYGSQGTPRPFVHFLFKVKAGPASSGDINPIHKIREILTDDTAMNKPESDVNDENFIKAADRIYDEGLGISWSVTEKSCLEAINELCGHIEAGVRMNRQTGLYEMVLFRDDWFDEDEIQTLPVNKIKSMSLDGATSADELINKLNVSYYNRDAIKNSSFSVAENAAIRNLNGHENSDEVKFPYFMNQRNAAIVSQWKLKQMSTPVWQGTFTTGFYEARKWNRYDLLRLEWPRKWAGTILVRIMKINLGTGTDVSIDFVEVVPYSSDLSSSIVIDTPVDTTPKPPQPALFKAFELSYLEAVQLNGQKSVNEALAYNPDAGYAAVIAKKPQDNSLSALMYTDIGNDFERVGTIAYCETAELDQNISQISSAFIVKDAGDIDMVSAGTQITVNNEIMVYQSYDEETGLLTVKRGALDTVPQNHLAGSVLYFADDFVTVDPTEYVTGEIINVKALTTTPSGILDLDDTEAQQVEIQARAIRPYPPVNVKINGEYWPVDEVTDDVQVSWVDRNRAQQTGGEILGFFDGGVTVENGVTYGYELFDSDTNTLVDSGSNITSPATIQKIKMAINNRLELFSIRDGYKSYQSFVYNFVKSSVELWDPSYIQKTLWIDANDALDDGSGLLASILDKSPNAFNFTSGSTGKFIIGQDTAINSKCLIRNGVQNAYHPTAGENLNRAPHIWTFYVVKNDSTGVTYGDAWLAKTYGSYYGNNFAVMRSTG